MRYVIWALYCVVYDKNGLCNWASFLEDSAVDLYIFICFVLTFVLLLDSVADRRQNPAYVFDERF